MLHPKKAAKWAAKRLLAPFGIRNRADLRRAFPSLPRLIDSLTLGALRAASVFVPEARRADTTVPQVLFVSHAQVRCGVHEFGLNIARVLENSRTVAFRYVECPGPWSLVWAVHRNLPAAIVYNSHPSTLPWLSTDWLRRVRLITNYQVRQISIIHECTQAEADAAIADGFDYHIVPDPTVMQRNPIVFPTGRLIPEYSNPYPEPEVVTVGSFGFATPAKRYEHVIEAVQKEFDRAIVRINIPYNDVADLDRSMHRAHVARCRNVPRKVGVDVRITHDWFDEPGLLKFLAQNSLNAFFYDRAAGRGISATVEQALAVNRPLAITRSEMFRHVWDAKPSICIEDNSLKTIIANGTAPLKPYVERWTAEHLLTEYEQIVREALRGKYLYETIDANGRRKPLNCILDNSARRLYEPAIRKLFLLAPELMERKIPEANVQQAFVLDTVQALAGSDFRKPRILCVGSYDDSASASLIRLGYPVVEIDPAINFDLRTFVNKHPARLGTFDIAFSTSVLEHVPEDEEFVGDIARLLAPGGFAVLTCDFNDRYRPGDKLPATDVRFYTQRDLRQRILPAMSRCAPLDEPDWDCPEPDFTYDDCRYTFATLTLRKRA